ncbi:MAG TPA: quinol:cytochrome C oxidoreductase, partial [Flavisolibacter sp.]|nr:quinol:cytochrome C oxidoreductase [Flavisolibacter sp.]
MAIKEQFVIPKKYNTFSVALMAIGILSIIILYITNGSKSDELVQARFWASLLQNSVYFLLVVNSAMFFICATTLAWGGWQMSFRRVSEAISVCVPVIGVITFVILMAVVFGGNHALYHWADTNMVKTDNALKHKSG